MRLDIYPEKAQYMKNEKIKLIIEIAEPSFKGSRALLQLTRLEHLVFENEYTLINDKNEILLQGMDTDFGGYGVYLTVSVSDNETERFHTAFDVVEDCRRAIRYGFLSNFHSEDKADIEDISNLRKFHINMVQYYDWSYRHDNMVCDTNKYQDMMGREVDLETVKKKISSCRALGMKSIGYGAVYAASKQYFNEHKENALYTSAEEPLVFIDTFYIMNIAKESAWRKHIIEEYASAVSMVGFDGIHMDTYGFPKTAFSFQKQKLIKMDEEYKTLIEDTKDCLNKITLDNHLIFNNVGNWPVKTVANTDQDAVYIEVWEPYCEYSHIKQIIIDAKKACEDQKPVILAAYLAPFRTDCSERAANAAYLLTAAITVNGAYHLLLGENNAVLTQGYYVDHSVMEAGVSEKMRSYYDFIVQYMEYFFDQEMSDVSMTHIGWDNTEYRCDHDKWSVDAKADCIWITIREKERRKIISLINLCGNSDSEWNQGKNQPVKQSDIRMQVQIDQPVLGLYLFSPDMYDARMQPLVYETIKTDQGWAIRFDIPVLEYWSNLCIDF